MTPQGSLKERLRRGDLLLGGEVATPLPWVPVAYANNGLSFAWIDMEHTLLDLQTVGQHILTCRMAGISSLVRVPDVDAGLVKRLLDNGANGIILPSVETADAAAALVRSCRFHPEGTRGASDPRFAHGLQDVSLADHLVSEQETVICVQIETRSGSAAVDEIASVEGIDLVVVGLGDLSVSFGRPGAVAHPDVEAAAIAIVSAARRAGVAAGVAGGYGTGAPLTDAIRRWREHGATFFHFLSDQGLLMDALVERADIARTALVGD